MLYRFMGMSESSLNTLTNPLQSCVSEVLGSFDCTMRSKCCENYKCWNFYYHCRTTNVNDSLEGLDGNDMEIIVSEINNVGL